MAKNASITVRLIQIGTRIYRVKVKPVGLRGGKPLSAIQVIKDMGQSDAPETPVTRSLHASIWRTSNLTAYVLTSVLDSITKVDP